MWAEFQQLESKYTENFIPISTVISLVKTKQNKKQKEHNKTKNPKQEKKKTKKSNPM